MDYEKLYKEALERAKNKLTNLVAYDIFPERKENEDEKVKRILHTIWDKMSFHLHDIFTEEEFQCFDAWSNAWLEKQGEPFDDNIITRDDEILQAISVGLTDAEEAYGWSDFGGIPIEEIQDWLEKQSEKEPTRSEEVEAKKIENTRHMLSDFFNAEYERGKADALQSLKWNKEDMLKVQRICKYLNEAKKYYADITEVRECIDWLKSLKERVGG